MSSVEKKIAVITGANRGLGKAIAENFAANNYSLLLCSRKQSDLDKIVGNLQKLHPSISIKSMAADLAQKEQTIAFGNWCLAQGTPNILVNNAGVFEPGSIYNEPENRLENQLAVNLYSAYYLTRTLLPVMMKNNAAKNEQRHIFNLCSTASLNAYKNGGSYSISKYALYGFSKNLREELKPFNVKVTHVIPGPTYTDSWSASGIEEKRFMQASDVAQMILAASQLSSQACVEELVLRPILGDI